MCVLQSKIASLVQQEKLKGSQPEVEEDSGYDPDDFEQLFASLVNAKDVERPISEPFHLLPYKTVSFNCASIFTESCVHSLL